MATTQKTTPITLTLTDKAAVEVRKFMADEHASAETAGLRVAVLPGGCSGFRYNLSIEEKPLDDDFVVETGGVRCFVDAFSAQHLNGTVIDFRSNFQESGFAFENPNATGGWGWGWPLSGCSAEALPPPLSPPHRAGGLVALPG